MNGAFLPLLQTSLIGFFSALAITGFMIWAGPVDHPNARSSHLDATPTAGGVGIIGGFGMAVFATMWFFPELPIDSNIAAILSLGFAIAALGLTDDLLTLNTRFKIASLMLIAALATFMIGPPEFLPNGLSRIELPYSLGFVGAVLWIFTVTNIVNFMDGANGLMGGYMAVMAMVMVMMGIHMNVPGVIVINLALLCAIAGFLPYNFKKKADIFSGDVGSLFAGFIFAVSVLMLAASAPSHNALYVGPLLLLPFLADGLLTMYSRLRAGEDLSSPHKNHLYQRLISKGWSHTGVTIAYLCAALICANIALFAVFSGLIASLWGLLFLAVIAGIIKTGIQNRL